MYFVFYMLVSAFWAALTVRFLRGRVPNRILIRCSACGSKLYQRPTTYRWAIIDYMAWALVAWVVVFRHQLPLTIMIPLVLVLLVVWAVTVHRLVRTYFFWRHPIRCQGGGHAKPVPQAT